jgi:hypothetical protein
VLASLAANAADAPSSIFVRAKCDGKLSSLVLSSLKDAINNSQKYQLIADLRNNGKNGVVFNISMTCVENDSVVSIATVYGLAKCIDAKVCHSALDGSSLNAALCNSNLAAECGQKLFKAFEFYLTIAPTSSLKLD